jgi:hypothetical protein
MQKKKFFKLAIFVVLSVQFALFIVLKQRISYLNRTGAKIEAEIEKKIDENRLLKIKLTTMQNQYKVRKLVEKYLITYKPIKPNQIIELEKL